VAPRAITSATHSEITARSAERWSHAADGNKAADGTKAADGG
jgi:hypothetical protein